VKVVQVLQILVGQGNTTHDIMILNKMAGGW